MEKLDKLKKLIDTYNFPMNVDSIGDDTVDDSDDGYIIDVDFVGKDGNLGSVILTLSESKLSIYYSKNVVGSSETWIKFLSEVKRFAKMHDIEFDIVYALGAGRRKHAIAAKKISEGYTGTSKSSYTAGKGDNRIIIRHNKNLDETDRRFNHIESIFIENSCGERFKLPHRSLSAAHAMREHVNQGGNPYDERGQHINQLVREIDDLNRFVRVTGNRLNEGDDDSVDRIIEAAKRRKKKNRKTLKKLSRPRGYGAYFAGWGWFGGGGHDSEDASEAMDESIETDIKQKFLVGDSKYDQVINEVWATVECAVADHEQLKNADDVQGGHMRELKEFEEWADEVIECNDTREVKENDEDITEDTWVEPKSDSDIEKLGTILTNELQLGPDATVATGLLYDLLGDDDLFAELEAAAEDDPSADARPFIADWINNNRSELMDKLEAAGFDIQSETVDADDEGMLGDLDDHDGDQLDDLDDHDGEKLADNESRSKKRGVSESNAQLEEIKRLSGM